MHKAMSILYRPVVNSFGNRYEIEEYKGDIWDDIMLDMPTSVAVSSLVFLPFRKRLVKSYPKLFGTGTGRNDRDITPSGNFYKNWGGITQ